MSLSIDTFIVGYMFTNSGKTFFPTLLPYVSKSMGEVSIFPRIVEK